MTPYMEWHLYYGYSVTSVVTRVTVIKVVVHDMVTAGKAPETMVAIRKLGL